MRMYDSSDSSIIWSEMVDLTKLSLADNELEMISDHVFPDWSAEEIADDEERSNQFGGLEGLDLHNNLLQEIPIGLRRLEQLTILNLSANRLSNKSLAIILPDPGLQELNLSRNALSGKVDLLDSVLQKLQILNLRENKIEALDVATGESALRVLDISNNRLRQLPLATSGTAPYRCPKCLWQQTGWHSV